MPPLRSPRGPLRVCCHSCRLRKVKCSGGPPPCRSCSRMSLDCVFPGDSPQSGQLSGDNPQLVAPTATHTEAGVERRRTVAACRACRIQKVKCSGRTPCRRCSQRRLTCVYDTAGERLDSPRLSDEPSAPLDARAQMRLCSKSTLVHHIDAYFDYVHHLPGYDFLHRPSILLDFHNDTLEPVMCMAICAAVAMYVSTSEQARRLSVEWSKGIDAYIFSHLHNLKLLNLQLMVLSMFQHFAYRQFGRVWHMHGMAARLAISLQLNMDRSSGEAPLAMRESARRLIWGLFIHDKIHSGGVEEFVALPDHWMHIPLPMSESNFQREIDLPTCTLSDSLASTNLGISSYMVVLHELRYRILRTTKSVINMATAVSETNDVLSSLVELQADLGAFYEKLPAHIKLCDRNILAYSAQPELAAYISLHTWYFQSGCDVFRICLPGAARESVPASSLARLPDRFVKQWRHLAVSFAAAMAQMWRNLFDMDKEGAVKFIGGMPPMSPAGAVSIHQCTKILQIARSYKIYSDLFDPTTGTTIYLDDQVVDELCRSNVAYLDGLAGIAPIAATVQQDVEDILKGSSASGVQEKVPVTSQVQKDKVLSRYHTLSMSIGTEPAEAPESSAQTMPSDYNTAATFTTESTGSTVGLSAEPFPNTGPPEVMVPQQEQYAPELLLDDAFLHNFGAAPWNSTPGTVNFSSENLAIGYCLAASQSDMSGELDEFLRNSMQLP